jgi:hypothetical protein
VQEIRGNARTVRELLDGVKYSIDYYQREYRWESKQIRELLDDLTGKFLQDFDPEHDRSMVEKYQHYFLGSIIISKKDTGSFIVDGQQRLTSLTLLLVLLRRLQIERGDAVTVDGLICAVKFGKRSMNLDVPERTSCIESLLEGKPVDATGRSESVRNIVDRYDDLQTEFPEILRDDALPYFVDWLLENVHLVEITAYSDEDAYSIFETMNDRGLSLTPTDMLKGFVLAKLDDGDRRDTANRMWRDRIRALNDAGKEVEPDFFKTWLRSQYATKIRERKKGARAEDFDRIGTEFHRWFRDSADRLGLDQSDEFFRFVDRDFHFYCRWYLTLVDAATRPVAGLERVFYNAQLGFTLQFLLLLAPLTPDDDDRLVRTKIGLVTRYVDIMLNRRIWNFRSIAYSTMQYTMFNVMRSIRGLEPAELADRLSSLLDEDAETTFASNDRFRVHQQNRYFVHRMLARLTDYVETGSGLPSHYANYVAGGRGRFEVEHIWANHPERHTAEFQHAADFTDYRNRIGGLLLLPKSFNGSYGDLPYEKKVPHYLTQNLLARSLHPQCYQHNPGFLRFVTESGLPFRAHDTFVKADLDERYALYQRIAGILWDPDQLRVPV